MPEFYPGINEYLENTENAKSVKSKDLEELIFKIRAYTGLEYDIALKIVVLYFQEIRNAMLRQDSVILADLGKFYISKKKFTPKFKPSKNIICKLNEK